MNSQVSSQMPSCLGTGREAAIAWHALVDDARAFVLVVDPSGRVEYLSAAAGEALGATLQGRLLGDTTGAARELATICHDAVASGRTETVRVMLRGHLLRCVVRPVGGKALVVARHVAPADPMKDTPEPGVVVAKSEDLGPLAILTTREVEILRLIGLGLSSADIAARLGRSVKTVEWHRVSLGDKLGVSNRVELARLAIAAGLVSPGPVQGPVKP